MLNPHSDVIYTLGGTTLSVTASDIRQINPIDPLYDNDMTSASITPAISRKLQYLSGTTWTDLTNTGMGIVNNGASCISSLSGSDYSFSLYCTDNTKFGINSAGQDVFYLRYVTWYTLVTSSIRYVYDPFTVTIRNQCADQQLTVSDAQRTAPQSIVAGTTLNVAGISYTNTASGQPTCVIDTLVEVQDMQTKFNWTSSSSNAFYAAFFDSTQTLAGPWVKVTPNGSVFTTITVVQVRVTYTARYSKQTDGSN